jgi:hypothetical protein
MYGVARALQRRGVSRPGCLAPGRASDQLGSAWNASGHFGNYTIVERTLWTERPRCGHDDDDEATCHRGHHSRALGSRRRRRVPGRPDGMAASDARGAAHPPPAAGHTCSPRTAADPCTTRAAAASGTAEPVADAEPQERPRRAGITAASEHASHARERAVCAAGRARRRSTGAAVCWHGSAADRVGDCGRTRAAGPQWPGVAGKQPERYISG